MEIPLLLTQVPELVDRFLRAWRHEVNHNSLTGDGILVTFQITFICADRFQSTGSLLVL